VSPAQRGLAQRAREKRGAMAGSGLTRPTPPPSHMHPLTTSARPIHPSERKVAMTAMARPESPILFRQVRSLGAKLPRSRCTRNDTIDPEPVAAGRIRGTRQLTCVMTPNRLIAPPSEHAILARAGRTTLADILGVDFAALLPRYPRPFTP